MNKLPILKSFLKDGEAESYEGVTVRYVAGRQAIMTIYEGGGTTEIEKIPLHTLKTKEEMHSLMLSKGFQLKSDHEVAKIQAEHRQAQSKEQKEREERLENLRKRKLDKSPRRQGEAAAATAPYQFIFGLSGAVALTFLVILGGRRRRKNRQAIANRK